MVGPSFERQWRGAGTCAIYAMRHALVAGDAGRVQLFGSERRAFQVFLIGQLFQPTRQTQEFQFQMVKHFIIPRFPWVNPRRSQ